MDIPHSPVGIAATRYRNLRCVISDGEKKEYALATKQSTQQLAPICVFPQLQRTLELLGWAGLKSQSILGELTIVQSFRSKNLHPQDNFKTWLRREPDRTEGLHEACSRENTSITPV